MASYSEFAKFYDAAMGGMSAKIEFLQGLIEKFAPDAKTVLEFASGTGTILYGLSQRYDVSGVDLSPEMVDVARKKHPGVDIRVGDITCVDFGKTFDVVLCIFDSINHLPDWESWCAAFENARKHLNERGLFIFDMNTAERLNWLAGNRLAALQLGEDFMIMNIERESSRFNWIVKIFEREADGRFTLHEDNIYEVAFSVEQVQAEVERNFRIKEVIDFEGVERSSPNWRPFYICRAE